MDAIKVFQMNDCDWIAARTKEEAIEFYKTASDYDYSEQEDEVIELDAAAMDRLQFIPDIDAEGSRSFAEQLQLMIDLKEEFPAFFASTEC